MSVRKQLCQKSLQYTRRAFNMPQEPCVYMSKEPYIVKRAIYSPKGHTKSKEPYIWAPVWWQLCQKNLQHIKRAVNMSQEPCVCLSKEPCKGPYRVKRALYMWAPVWWHIHQRVLYSEKGPICDNRKLQVTLENKIKSRDLWILRVLRIHNSLVQMMSLLLYSAIFR